MMATITLEYNYNDLKAQKTLEYILSQGLFRSAMNGKEETVAEKRKKLDSELKGYTVDLSNFKFNREEANIYE
jgi:hypothetical protein